MAAIVFYTDSSLERIAPVPFTDCNTEIHLFTDNPEHHELRLTRYDGWSPAGQRAIACYLIQTGDYSFLRLVDECPPPIAAKVKVVMIMMVAATGTKKGYHANDSLSNGFLYYGLPKGLINPNLNLPAWHTPYPCHVRYCASGEPTLAHYRCENERPEYKTVWFLNGDPIGKDGFKPWYHDYL